MYEIFSKLKYYERKPNRIIITEGSTRSPLHFTEAKEVNHFENIKEGDFFVLTDQRKRTRILMYDGLLVTYEKCILWIGAMEQ